MEKYPEEYMREMLERLAEESKNWHTPEELCACAHAMADLYRSM